LCNICAKINLLIEDTAVILLYLSLRVFYKNTIIMRRLYYYISTHSIVWRLLSLAQRYESATHQGFMAHIPHIIRFSNQMSDDYMLSRATRRIEIERQRLTLKRLPRPSIFIINY